MENLLDKISAFYLETADYALIPTNTEVDKEWELYSILYEHLSEEYRNILLEYIHIRGTRRCEEIKTAYKQGFKAAIHLFTESLKEKRP